MKLFEFHGEGKTPITGYDWNLPQPKAVLMIIHGMSEHAARYDHFANYLNDQQIAVFSSDLRGHGKTAGSLDKVGLFAMQDGWQKIVEDQLELEQHIRQIHPHVPLFILGHSMGSFVARSVSFTGKTSADGFIFSATAGHPGVLGSVGKHIARINMKAMGKKNRSKMLSGIAFGGYTKKYKDKRTEKDWLSRDPKVVDAYISDPYCMQTFTSQFFNDLLEGVLSVNDNNNISKMAPVPYYLFYGTMDPVGEYGKGPLEVYEKLKKRNYDVEIKSYEAGRHEMLNEINKEEVYRDVVSWIDHKLANA